MRAPGLKQGKWHAFRHYWYRLIRDKVIESMRAASLTHPKLMRAIELLGSRIAPQLHRELVG